MAYDIKKMAEDLEISRIVIIDDDLPKKDKDLQKLNDAYKSYMEEVRRRTWLEEFKDICTDEKEYQMICSTEYEINEDNELNSRIYDFLCSKEYIKQPAKNEQLQGLTTFLQNELSTLAIIENNGINEDVKLMNRDLIIIDYNLDKQQKDLKGHAIIQKINAAIKKNKQNEEPVEHSESPELFNNFYYVLFISSNTEVKFNDNSNDVYNLKDYPRKNEFFRKLRKEFSAYEFVVFNFLHKDLLIEETSLSEEFTKILYEFSISKTFFNFLDCLSNKIEHSKSIVFNDFYSLNLRTLKNIIKDNIEKEGVSEFEFFNDLICKLINKENSDPELIKSIHNSANEIKAWSEPIVEYHLDKTLLEIREKELYKDSNSYFAPIQFGDIFSLDLGDGTWLNLLLISQQCDMTIRNNGERATKNVTLLKDDKSKGCCVRTEKYDAEKKKLTSYNWYKREPVLLPADILDLVSLNNQGTCSINMKVDANTISKKLLTDNHRKRIIKFYDNLILEIRKTEENIKSLNNSTLQEKLRFVVINGITVRYKIDEEQNVDFGIKRLNRLDEDITQEIQQGYANQLNRIGQALAITGKGFTDINFSIKIFGCDCKKIKAKIIEFDLNNKCVLIDYKDCMKILEKFSKTNEFLNLKEIVSVIENYASEPFYFEGDNTKYIRIDGEDIIELKSKNIDLNVKEENIEIKLHDISELFLDHNPKIPENEFFIKGDDKDKLGLFVVDRIVTDLGIDYCSLGLHEKDVITKPEEKVFVNINSTKIKNLIEYSYGEEGALVIRKKCIPNHNK